MWEKNNFYPCISINLHPDTLSNDKVIIEIQKVLKNRNVEFEIIERSFLNNEKAKKNYNFLIENNFNISIDDFGTGYACFRTLCIFTIHAIKIDKSLIDLLETKKGYIICKHIIQLCKESNFVSVAEGVETKEQFELLKKLEIDYIQGYYFSPAIRLNIQIANKLTDEFLLKLQI
jgi:EAL domain-containing protein (putative c-di-GMP-specific phosphodiesterase class I)